MPVEPNSIFLKIYKKLGLGWIIAAVSVIVFVAVSFAFWYRSNAEDLSTIPEIPEVITYGNLSIPIAKGVDTNPYDAECFKLQDGIMIYDSPEVTTFKGVDVSSHQKVIDWAAVKAWGIDFAMIRVGYRGYTMGGLMMDSRFIANINYAEAAGIDIGIYFFSQAITVEEAREEAELVLKWLKGYDITYPIVFDWEHYYEEDSRTKDITGEIISACALEFCNTIYQAGYTPMVYFNLELAYVFYDLEMISAYDFWLAEYNEAPTFFYDFKMLQYNNRGIIPGIPEEVDLNICFVDYKAQNIAK